MTFIASVVAKKGVVIIADSLVTTEKPILQYQDFSRFLKAQPTPKRGKLKLTVEQILNLFEVQPSYTKDYQEKLFRYTNNIAITIAGSAWINDKKIEVIIEEAIKTLKPGAIPSKKTVEQKVEEFKQFILEQAKQHIEKFEGISTTVFIFTSYAKATHETKIYKIFINRTSKAILKKRPDFEIVSSMEQPADYKVVCEGQNRISERILFGDIDLILHLIPRIAEKIIKDYAIDPSKIPKDYVTNLTHDKDLLTDQFFEDIKMYKIKELSIQQAYDLACLLMRIERDIQKYTQNIPTVGGVVKIAKIDDSGFEFITGDGINHTEKF
jgi:hypothetical protein